MLNCLIDRNEEKNYNKLNYFYNNRERCKIMKSKYGFAKKFMSVLLCFLIAISTAVPAFAMEERRNSINIIDDVRPDNPTLENTKQILLKLNLASDADIIEKLNAEFYSIKKDLSKLTDPLKALYYSLLYFAMPTL